MLDIGWSEMLMIAAVAIIVIGPKEIPHTLGAIGRWVGKARSLTREFQSNVDDMIAQSEIAELKETANPMGDFNAQNILEDTTSPRINEINQDNDQLTQLEGEKNLGGQHSEVEKRQDDTPDKKMANRATET